MLVRATENFTGWLRSLRDHQAKARINRRILRIQEEGYFGRSKSVGQDVREMKLDFGPGYRLYYTMQGQIAILLLLGGDKNTQRKDIERAHQIVAQLRLENQHDTQHQNL